MPRKATRVALEIGLAQDGDGVRSVYEPAGIDIEDEDPLIAFVGDEEALPVRVEGDTVSARQSVRAEAGIA